MNISAALVKELREKTGCPIMDCKKALAESGGDIEAAVEVLRRHGHEAADKRKDRMTAEGLVAGRIDPEGRRASLVEFLCETDFVARSPDFTAFAGALVDRLQGLDAPPASPDALLDGDLAETFKEVQGKLKENLRIGRIARLDAGPEERVEFYAHFNGRIAVALLVGLSDPAMGGKPPVLELLKDLCMQAAFAAPLGIRREDVPADLVEKERAVLLELDEVKSKPEKIRPKIVEGKLAKFFKEHAFLEQEFVKEKKLSVKAVIGQVGAQAGGTLEVRRIERFEVGKE